VKYLAVSAILFAGVVVVAAPQDAATHYRKAEASRKNGDSDNAVEVTARHCARSRGARRRSRAWAGR
jgi:hypothetical protein